MSNLFADHPGLEPGTLELTAPCSAIELVVIGRPSTDFSQVWTLVPEVPTYISASRLKHFCSAGWSCGLSSKEPSVRGLCRFALPTTTSASTPSPWLRQSLEIPLPRTGRPLYAPLSTSVEMAGIEPASDHWSIVLLQAYAIFSTSHNADCQALLDVTTL